MSESSPARRIMQTRGVKDSTGEKHDTTPYDDGALAKLASGCRGRRLQVAADHPDRGATLAFTMEMSFIGEPERGASASQLFSRKILA